MTIEQAIAQSIRQTETVTLDYDKATYDDLVLECEDWVEGNEVYEFWGTDEGSDWRVHMSKS